MLSGRSIFSRLNDAVIKSHCSFYGGKMLRPLSMTGINKKLPAKKPLTT